MCRGCKRLKEVKSAITQYFLQYFLQHIYNRHFTLLRDFQFLSDIYGPIARPIEQRSYLLIFVCSPRSHSTSNVASVGLRSFEEDRMTCLVERQREISMSPAQWASRCCRRGGAQSKPDNEPAGGGSAVVYVEVRPSREPALARWTRAGGRS